MLTLPCTQGHNLDPCNLESIMQRDGNDRPVTHELLTSSSQTPGYTTQYFVYCYTGTCRACMRQDC